MLSKLIFVRKIQFSITVKMSRLKSVEHSKGISRILYNSFWSKTFKNSEATDFHSFHKKIHYNFVTIQGTLCTTVCSKESGKYFKSIGLTILKLLNYREPFMTFS